MVINSEPADLNKTPGQDVQSKTAQELNAIEGYRFFYSPVAVIFGNECDITIGNIEDALVCNGHPVCVCIGPGI